MNENKKDFKNMILGFGVITLYLVASLSSLNILSIFNINYNNFSLLGKAIYAITYEALLTLIIIFIYRKDFIPDLKIFVKNNAKYFKKYIKYWFLVIILMILSNGIVTMFTNTDTAANQEIIVNTLKKAPIYIFITTVFIAPILEELVFRLSFKKIFAHTNFLFILFSGFIFGSMHVIGSLNNITDILFIIPYSIPGFIFAYTYIKSENICVPISLHFIHNGVSMCLQIILTFLI